MSPRPQFQLYSPYSWNAIYRTFLRMCDPMLKWAVGQRNPTPGQPISSLYSTASAEGEVEASYFRRATDRLHVARRRNSRGAVRRAAVRSLKRTTHDKENQPCLTPENVSSQTRGNSSLSHIQMALRDVSNSPDPYMITPKRHFIKRRQSHPLNLITKKSLNEHSKSAPTNTLDYLKNHQIPRSKPLPPFNLPLTLTTSQRSPQQSTNSYTDISDVVDMRKPNSTLKSLLAMQIEYSPGPLTATQSLVSLRKRLTKSLGNEATPQEVENSLYYALNPLEKRPNNGITITCNEPSPTLEGLLEEKSIFDQVSDKFEFINSLKKDNSRIENSLVTSLSQRLEWLRLNSNFGNVNLIKEGENHSRRNDQEDTEGRTDERMKVKKRRDGGDDYVHKKIKTNSDGAFETGYGLGCDKEKPKTIPKPKLMGLTLPLGIPSPVTSEDSGLCSLGLEGIHPLSSSPIELDEAEALIEDAPSKYHHQEDESISTSLLVKCSPSSACSSLRKRISENSYDSNGSRDNWSEEVVPLVKTPKLLPDNRFRDEPSSSSSVSMDDVLPSPLALVEKRSRSRRCLRFVSPSGSTCPRQLSSRRPLSLSCPRLRDGREGAGELELTVNCNHDYITVYVGRGTDLHRPSGAGCNAYVKVALVPSSERTFFRTPVHRESSSPNFNEKFSFKFYPKDLNKQILVSVWHRDRDNRKSEFLGCVSLAVKNAVKKEISGSFRLVAQSGGSKTSNQHRSVQSSPGPSIPGAQSMMARRSGNTRLEEVITVEDEPQSSPEKHCKLASKKKFNDDSSFLRHLELEPLEGEGGRGPLPEAIAKGGRTPFTTTKQLTKQPGSGFGFSIAWVQPPRVERVEAGQSADRAGIRPGDYVIFVDRHNVVTMSEEQVLEIIKSCGNELTLEVYRKASPNGVVEPPSSLPSSSSAPAGYGNHPTRSSTACSAATSTSLDFTKRRLHLPQVSFNNEAGHLNPEDSRKKVIYQLLTKEQHYANNLQFGINRFMVPLTEKREFLNPTQHHILFQNIEELLHLTEDTIEQAVQEDVDLIGSFIGRLYLKQIPTLTAAYRRYCAGIKRADCLLAEKSKNTEFTRFCAEPPIPRRRPDLTTFLHKPLEHYREMLKLLQTILNMTKTSDSDHVALSRVVNEMQTTFREVTAGLMEPEVEGRPLLSVQDLESRLVFTRCKPFVLSTPGRQWIFGGDLSRVEGRVVRPFWALLFTDMMVFAKVSRDRVLFITEEPLSLLAVSQAYFNIRKKANEFRLLLSNREPGTDSPANAKCGPEISLSRTPKKNSKCRSVALRAPTPELKAVWQNLIQRQIIYLNTIRGGTPASSPLESPDPPTTLSAATLDSFSIRRQLANKELKNASQTQKLYQDIKEISTSSEGCSKLFNDLIDHKCRQLSKTKTGKDGAMHLAEWMKDQLGTSEYEGSLSKSQGGIWKQFDGGKRNQAEVGSSSNMETRCDEVEFFSDKVAARNAEGSHQSFSKSESQTTIKSNNQEKHVSMCRQCHKTCLNSQEKHNFNLDEDIEEEEDEFEDSWGSLMVEGMCGILPTAIKTSKDPFTPAEPPSISVLPPTPDKKLKNTNSETRVNCNSLIKLNNVSNCSDQNKIGSNATSDVASTTNIRKPRIKISELTEADDDDTPEESVVSDELPYKTLPSSSRIRRFGTLTSLEKVSSDETFEQEDQEDETGDSEKDEEDEEEKSEVKIHPPEVGDSIRDWTVRAGSFVAAKMAFFERLSSPDYSVTVRKTTFLERYLKPSGENHLDSSPDPGTNTPSSGRGEDEGETSGATSGEEIWGTPTSGGEFEEELVGESSALSFMESPRGSIGTDDDTEQLMEDLLISLPMLAARAHGVPLRRRLEPLLEEEDSESSSAPCSPKLLREIKTDQGRGPGGSQQQQHDNGSKSITTDSRKENSHRTKTGVTDRALGIPSDEDEDILDNVASSPSLLCRLGLKRNDCSRKSSRILGFLSGRKVEENVSYRNSATYGAKPLFRYLFNKDSEDMSTSLPNDDIPTTLPRGFPPPRRNEKQLERRFWKHLRRRRRTSTPTTVAQSTSQQIAV